MLPQRAHYGTTQEGEAVDQFTLCNRNGLAVSFLNYGCRLTRILLPSRAGCADILLGFDGIAAYETDETYQGALVGRYANRIRGAEFALQGRAYHLTKNDGENYLHGSFHRRVFDVEFFGEGAVRFSARSPAGEDGFPGSLRIRVGYTLDEENRFTMAYEAEADAATHVNFSNHAYFNLSAGADATIERHLLRLNAGHFLEIGEDLCPTGRILKTAGSPFDFTRGKPIGRDIGMADGQLERADGYDHCFLLDEGAAGNLVFAAEASDAEETRCMRVFTTQPALQFYSGNFLDGSVSGKGRALSRRSGFCLETEHYPDSPNRPAFPSTLLQPGDMYREVTVLEFRFS